MNSSKSVLGALLAFILVIGSGAMAAEPEAFVYHRSPGEIGQRDLYLWGLLGDALDHTRDSYGDFLMRPGPEMEQARRIRSLESDDGSITVSVFPIEQGLSQLMTPVRIPVDRGLLGYRILLIRSGTQSRFDSVNSLADLQSFRFCMMPSWVDSKIMRAAGLTIVESPSFTGMFRMLAAGRCDAISRSSSEVVGEFDRRDGLMSGLAIESSLVLFYPLPSYFWFSRSPAGQHRAARVTAGLARMFADGSFQKRFETEFGPSLARLALAKRRLIPIDNPMLGPDDQILDEHYWYRSHAQRGFEKTAFLSDLDRAGP